MAGLKGKRWLRLCAQLRGSSDVHICHICRKLINMDAPPRHPMSFSVDHDVARSRGGAAYDPTNLRAAHYGCNSSKGARPVRGRPLRMSRGWH